MKTNYGNTEIKMNLPTLENIKDHIFPFLAPVEWNVWGLKKTEQLAYKSFLDLAIYYYIRLEGENETQVKTAWINRKVLEKSEITLQDLNKLAMKNMDNENYSIQSISSIFLALPIGSSYIKGTKQIPLYILSNEKMFFGSIGLLKKNLIASFAKKNNKNLYILPSSIHEILLLPGSDEINAESLNQIVKEINYTWVTPEERLADHIYYYDIETDTIQPVI